MSGQIKLRAASLGGDVALAATDTASSFLLTLPAATGNVVVSTTNLAYSPYIGFRNRIINGEMDIDQRRSGAAVTPSADTYLLDRWQYSASQTSKFTWQQNAGSITPPVGFVNYLGGSVASAVTIGASDYFALVQKIEGFNVADLGWGTANAQTVTLSFRVYSSLTGTFGGTLTNSANNRSYPFTYSIPAANTWTSISITIAGDTSGTWLTTNGVGIGLQFGLGVGSTFSGTAGAWSGTQFISATGATSVVGTAGATFYITGVQFERGSNATPFDFRSIGQELGLCQRYFQLAGGASSGSFDGSTTTIQITEKLLVTMRTAPTASIQPSGYAGFRSSANDFNAASPALSNFSSNTPTSFWTQVTGFSGGTSGAVVTGRNNNVNNNFIALSAEL